MQILNNLSDGQTLFIYLTLGSFISSFICYLMYKLEPKKTKHKMIKKYLKNDTRIENIEREIFLCELRMGV